MALTWLGSQGVFQFLQFPNYMQFGTLCCQFWIN